MIELSIVIPAYNEANRLPKTLATIEKFFHDREYNVHPDRGRLRVTGLGRPSFLGRFIPAHGGAGYLRPENRVKKLEIIVVDDGSVDRTVDNLKTEKLNIIQTIKLDRNYGKGYAVKTGVMAAKGQYILMMDADGSIPIAELDKLWLYREQFDVVIGSRFLASSRFNTRNIKRMVVSKLGNILFRLLFQMDIRDTQCGFKLFQAQAAKKIFSQTTIDRFGFDMEMLVLAKKFGYSIKEIPISWQDAPGSSIRAVRTSWQTLGETIKIWRKYQ